MAVENENKTNTEGVGTSSVDTVETVDKKFHDNLISEKDAEIKKLKTDLSKEKEYSEGLEAQLSDYSKQLDSKAQVAGEFDHIPLVNVVDGVKKTRDEIVADKKLLKLFKK